MKRRQFERQLPHPHLYRPAGSGGPWETFWLWLEVRLQAGDHQAGALVELGGAVVVGEFGGEGAELWELASRQPMQAGLEQVVGSVGVFGEFL